MTIGKDGGSCAGTRRSITGYRAVGGHIVLGEQRVRAAMEKRVSEELSYG